MAKETAGDTSPISERDAGRTLIFESPLRGSPSASIAGVFEVSTFRDGKWTVLYSGQSDERAWAVFEEAKPKSPGILKITQDGELLKSLQMFATPDSKRKGEGSRGPWRKIVRWVGPAAALVLLECGHKVSAAGSKKARCAECAHRSQSGGRSGSRRTRLRK